MATVCPLCKESNLIVSGNMVRCSQYQAEKDKASNEWYNAGTCEFRVNMDNKFMHFTPDDIKQIVMGKTKVDKKTGRKAYLDLKSQYFIIVEFPPKEEREL